MSTPCISQLPLAILLIPHLDSVVRRSRDNAISIIIELCNQYQVAMTGIEIGEPRRHSEPSGCFQLTNSRDQTQLCIYGISVAPGHVDSSLSATEYFKVDCYGSCPCAKINMYCFTCEARRALMRLAGEYYIMKYRHYSALGKLLTSVPWAPFAVYLPPDPAVRSIRQNTLFPDRSGLLQRCEDN